MDKNFQRSAAGLLALIILLSLMGCFTTRSLNTLNLSSLYEKPQNLQAKAVVLNLNDSASAVFLRITFNHAGMEISEPKSTIRVSYTVFSSLNQGKIIDSASFAIADSSLVTGGIFKHSWVFRAPRGKDYFIKISVEHPGLNHKPVILIRELAKIKINSSNSLLARDPDGELIYENYHSVRVPFRLYHPGNSDGQLKVSCYFRNFPPAIPPFTFGERPAFDYKVDSIFFLALRNGYTDDIALTRKGLYMFSNDSSSTEGFPLIICDPGYPRITQAGQMVESLRYITSSREYETLAKARPLKPAVDSFWVANAGNVDHASAMIRNYYLRVEEANRLFISFTEGWKTDRGMIFIIFGQPDIVYRSDSQEQWIYGEAGNIRSLRFTFDKVINPFTHNDFILERSEMFKTVWYNSVQLWRR